MYYKLQQWFVWILNPIYEKMAHKIPNVMRNMIIGACFAMMFSFQIFKRSDFSVWNGMSNTKMALVGCILLGIVIIVSTDRRLKPIAAYNKFAELLLICGVIIMVISFIHPVGDGFRALALIMTVGFPCLYCVWGNRKDYDKLFELAAKGIAIAGAFYFAYCILYVRFDLENTTGGRFYGTVDNPNFLGMICTAVICMTVYLVINGNKGSMIYAVIGGIAFVYLWISVSRTSILAAFAALLTFVIYFIKTKLSKPEERSRQLVKLFIVLFIFVTAAIIGSILNQVVYDRSLTVFENRKITAVCVTAQAEGTVVSDDNPNSVTNRMDSAGKDMNVLSSGRIDIWKVYIDQLNLLGNDGNVTGVFNGTTVYGTHNVCLDIAYRTGIINGLIFLIFEAVTVLYSIMHVVKTKYRKPFFFFTASSVLAFFIFSALESATMPFSHPPALLYYVGIAPLFFKQEEA